MRAPWKWGTALAEIPDQFDQRIRDADPAAVIVVPSPTGDGMVVSWPGIPTPYGAVVRKNGELIHVAAPEESSFTDYDFPKPGDLIYEVLPLTQGCKATSRFLLPNPKTACPNCGAGIEAGHCHTRTMGPNGEGFCLDVEGES